LSVFYASDHENQYKIFLSHKGFKKFSNFELYFLISQLLCYTTNFYLFSASKKVQLFPIDFGMRNSEVWS